MKTKRKIILGISLLIVVGIILYIFVSSHNYYKMGESDQFNISIGESFTVKFMENGSTGYSNCWINKNSCPTVELIDEDYTASWLRIFGSNGVGGKSSWTFKGKRKGIDTIKITFCPTGQMNKDCSFFSDNNSTDQPLLAPVDSISKDAIAYYQKHDYLFIVNVN